MRDFLFLIYFILMGFFGLMCYFFILIGMIVYYPIWKMSNRKSIKNHIRDV